MLISPSVLFIPLSVPSPSAVHGLVTGHSPGVVVRVPEQGPAPVTNAVDLGAQGQAAVQVTPCLVLELSAIKMLSP